MLRGTETKKCRKREKRILEKNDMLRASVHVSMCASQF